MNDPTPTARCPKCGFADNADARYCLQCGALLTDRRDAEPSAYDHAPTVGHAAPPPINHAERLPAAHAAPSPYPPPSYDERHLPVGHAHGGPLPGHALASPARPITGLFERARPVLFFLLLALIGVLLYVLLFR